MREVIEAIDGSIQREHRLAEKATMPTKVLRRPRPSPVAQAQEALVNVLDGALIVDLATEAHPSLPVLVERRTGTGD